MHINNINNAQTKDTKQLWSRHPPGALMHSNRHFRDTTTLEVVYVVLHLYRPQTKFAKVMFLHVSVILSTGGCLLQGGVCSGGEVCSQIGGLLRGVFAPRGVYSEGICSQGGSALGGSAPGWTGLLWGVSAPWGCLLWGRGVCYWGSPGPSPRDSYSCGRYASYCNAFLFYVKIYWAWQ